VLYLELDELAGNPFERGHRRGGAPILRDGRRSRERLDHGRRSLTRRKEQHHGGNRGERSAHGVVAHGVGGGAALGGG
jgi:hypothetical protein